MDTAPKPSASAMARATAAICWRVKRGRRPPGSGRAQIGPDARVLDIRTAYSLGFSYYVLWFGAQYERSQAQEGRGRGGRGPQPVLRRHQGARWRLAVDTERHRA